MVWGICAIDPVPVSFVQKITIMDDAIRWLSLFIIDEDMKKEVNRKLKRMMQI